MNIQDPIIEIIRNMHCEKCGSKCVHCDCWVLNLIQPERLSEETHYNNEEEMKLETIHFPYE